MAILADLKPLDEPPKHTEETIARFQDTLRDIFISADTPVTKGYSRFLVEKIVVHDDHVEIQARSAKTPWRSWPIRGSRRAAM